MRFETLAIHAGQEPDPSTGAVMTPIFQTSTFARTGPTPDKGYEYSRTGNPTRTALEKCLAALEGAAFGAAFSSGCGAADAVIHTLSAGDHVVVSDDVYGGTYRLFTRVYAQLGIATTFADLSRPGALEAALTPATRLVWIETPTNPLLKLADLAAIARVARARGVRTACDNTFMSPYFQQPLAAGIDLVVHSSTKWINGHSDVVGGFVGTNDPELAQRIAFFQNAVGAVPSPHDCFLTLRGLKTLPVRMDRHAANAMAVARFLADHPSVASVTYPGLPTHAQHALAAAQMRGFGGMLTFEVRGGEAAAWRVLRALEVFTCAESLGGVESLIEHPASMTHASIPAATRRELGITDGLIRASVGIEHEADLVADLANALKAA
jgi:cystathionine gamma-lyase